MEKKLLFSIFDHSGNISEPYRNDPNWDVVQVDIKHGQDILTFDFKGEFEKRINHSVMPEVGLIFMTPCTDYALSGARHFKAKDADGRTAQSQLLVAKCKEIIDYFHLLGILAFWHFENPMSRIHTLNPWLGKPVLKFNPCDYAGYLDDPDSDRYNKTTWIWGNFNIPTKKRLEPIYKENPGWRNLGGKSERTKELRSITPKGFCKAMYEFNS